MKNNKTCHLFFFLFFYCSILHPSFLEALIPTSWLRFSSSSFSVQLEPGVLYSLDGIYSRLICLLVKLIWSFKPVTDHSLVPHSLLIDTHNGPHH